MRWLALVPILFFSSSCSTFLSTSPSLPFVEFIDQVLDPLAGKLADERIEQAKAQLRAGGNQYSVCVEGAERRYGVESDKFVRLIDWVSPCELTILKTLTKGGGN